MAYERLHWVESETPLSADNMNNIEDGIEELQAQKVDKVSGKALSDNNYTSDDKTKLAGIEAGAQVNPDEATTSAAGLMSASDKTKLDGIAAGAQVNRTYTAVTGKPTAAASPAFGGTVTVSQVAQSSTGQVSVTDRVITIPSSDATTSTHGLMSAADKTKLNGIAAGAQVNPGNATTSAAGLMSASDKSKLNGIEAGANNYALTTETLTAQLSGATSVSSLSGKTLTFSATGLTSSHVLCEINLDCDSGICISGWHYGNGSMSVRVFNASRESITIGSSSYIRLKKYK